MQVSAISANRFNALQKLKTDSDTKPETSNTFTSSSKNEKALFDTINEWKCFCHKQIAENKTDYII